MYRVLVWSFPNKTETLQSWIMAGRLHAQKPKTLGHENIGSMYDRYWPHGLCYQGGAAIGWFRYRYKAGDKRHTVIEHNQIVANEAYFCSLLQASNGMLADNSFWASKPTNTNCLLLNSSSYYASLSTISWCTDSSVMVGYRISLRSLCIVLTMSQFNITLMS